MMGSVHASYPSTYPFQNEEMVPPALNEATPSYSFDESDTGGYIYTYHTNRDLNNDVYPFAFTGRDGWMYGFVHVFGAPPLLPDSLWNCSAKDDVGPFADADFTGKSGKQTVCKSENCCKSLIDSGLPKYGNDQMDWAAWLTDKVDTGLCGDIEIEEQYCIFTAGHMNTNCFEYIPEPASGARPLTFPCHDVAVGYWLSCPAYKQGGFEYYDLEPKNYDDNLTVEQYVVLNSVWLQPDRICHPKSYYIPSSPGPGSESDDDDDDSSASKINLLLLAFLAIFS
jgi:hypothetical protein